LLAAKSDMSKETPSVEVPLFAGRLSFIFIKLWQPSYSKQLVCDDGGENLIPGLLILGLLVFVCRLTYFCKLWSSSSEL
jgi:hypothetical protein